MSDIDMEGEAAGEELEGGKKKLSGKFLVLYIILPVLVLAGIGYGAYSFVFPSSENASTTVDGVPAAQVELTETGDPVFFDLPEFLVNLTSPDGGPTRYLKLRVSLQLPDEDAVSQIEAVMPRVVDGFQVYLRELRPSDFQGSSNMFLLREELLRRVNLAARPVRVNDVLFREVIVQ